MKWIKDTNGDCINVAQITSIWTRSFGEGTSVIARLSDGTEHALKDFFPVVDGYVASLRADLFIDQITGG